MGEERVNYLKGDRQRQRQREKDMKEGRKNKTERVRE